MKKIGLIGGMSWASTVEYYRMINEMVGEKLGGYHSAELILYSVDFDEIETNMQHNRWEPVAEVVINAAQSLERAGADMVLICGNTVHKVADQVQASVSIPLMHIADVTAEAISRAGLKKAGLLGTRFTMEQHFITDRLVQHGLDVLIPEEPDRKQIHRIIFDELVKDIISPDSRTEYVRIIERLRDQGAECIILGCTEIGLLIKQEDSPLPLFDTVYCHARHAVDMALQ